MPLRLKWTHTSSSTPLGRIEDSYIFPKESYLMMLEGATEKVILENMNIINTGGFRVTVSKLGNWLQV